MFNARCSRWIPLLATVLGLSAARAADALPTADELLAKQIQALGGKAALQKMTSRVLQAQLTSPMMLSNPALWHPSSSNSKEATAPTNAARKGGIVVSPSPLRGTLPKSDNENLESKFIGDRKLE